MANDRINDHTKAVIIWKKNIFLLHKLKYVVDIINYVEKVTPHKIVKSSN